MQEIIKKNRAVILFIQDSIIELRNKNLFDHKSGSLLNIFTNKILSSIIEAKNKIDFDFIVSTDSDKYYLYKDFIRINQSGENFKEKFENSLSKTFSLGYQDVIIIGNDSPEFSASHLITAFNKLQNKNNAVIGPSKDGGFYLLGLNFFNKSILNNISWQSKSVFTQLLKNITREDRNYSLLETLIDIDNKNDLLLWLSEKTPFGLSIRKIIFSFLELSLPEYAFHPSLIKRFKIFRRINLKSPPY